MILVSRTVGVTFVGRSLLWVTEPVPTPALCQDLAANHGLLPTALQHHQVLVAILGGGGSCALQLVSEELRRG